MNDRPTTFYTIYIYIHFVNLLYIYIYQEDYILMLLQKPHI